MSSLRPESNKIHSLGTDNYRWSKLSVGQINANDKVVINNETSPLEEALVITGSMSISAGGDISLFDQGHNNKEYKVLETLLLLSESVNTPNTIDESNLLHLSGSAETVTSFKTFSGGVQFKLDPNTTYTISGTIDSGSNDESIATTKWVTNKVSNITIYPATADTAGKVRLATLDQYNSGTNSVSVNGIPTPLVAQPAYIKSKFDSLLSQLANGLNYKGALSITNNQLPNSITGSLLGDFYYIQSSGSVSITGSDLETTSSIQFNPGNLMVFKNNVSSGSLNTTQFDLIQNTLNFQEIKNQLISGNVSNEEYYANSLYSKGMIGVDENKKYTYVDFIKKEGFKAEINDAINPDTNLPEAASFDFSDSKSFKVPNFLYDTTPPSSEYLHRALNYTTVKYAAKQNISLGDLSNVITINDYAPSHDQILTWNSGSIDGTVAASWYPKTLTISSELKSLTDVDIITGSDPPTGRQTLSNGHILIYSGNLETGKWISSASVPLSNRIAYTSGSSTNLSGSQIFETLNVFSNGLNSTKFFISSSLDRDYLTGSDYQGFKILPGYEQTNFGQNEIIRDRILLLSNVNNVANIDWVTKKSLKKVNTIQISNPDTNIQLLNGIPTSFPNDEYVKLKLDESKQNFYMFNDFIWVFRINDGCTNSKVTLPNYRIYPYNLPLIKKGFTLTIKNIPQSDWDNTKPEDYTIMIQPITDQYIDGIQDDLIPLVPYSSITFVVSDQAATGWIII